MPLTNKTEKNDCRLNHKRRSAFVVTLAILPIPSQLTKAFFSVFKPHQYLMLSIHLWKFAILRQCFWTLHSKMLVNSIKWWRVSRTSASHPAATGKESGTPAPTIAGNAVFNIYIFYLSCICIRRFNSPPGSGSPCAQFTCSLHVCELFLPPGSGSGFLPPLKTRWPCQLTQVQSSGSFSCSGSVLTPTPSHLIFVLIHFHTQWGLTLLLCFSQQTSGCSDCNHCISFCKSNILAPKSWVGALDWDEACFSICWICFLHVCLLNPDAAVLKKKQAKQTKSDNQTAVCRFHGLQLETRIIPVQAHLPRFTFLDYN